MALPKVETPRYETRLPSTGKKVSFRPFLVKEEKILMLALESNDRDQMLRAAKDIIRSCTYEQVDPNDLTLFDIEFLFLKLRAKSVGEQVELPFKCEHCQASTPVLINLDTVTVDSSKAKSGKIKITDKIGVEMRYPRVEMATEVTQGETNSLKVVAECIVSVWDDKKVYADSTIEERMELIENLTTEQFKAVDEFFSGMPTLRHQVKWECQKCKKPNSFVVEGLQNFFSSPSPTTA